MGSRIETVICPPREGDETTFHLLLEHLFTERSSGAFYLRCGQDIGGHPSESIPLGVCAGYRVLVHVPVAISTFRNTDQPAPAASVGHGGTDICLPSTGLDVRYLVDDPSIPRSAFHTFGAIQADHGDFSTGDKRNRQVGFPDAATQEPLRDHRLQ